MAEPDLKIKFFGCFDILYRGRTIFVELNSSVKAVAILRFLVAHAGKLFTSEAIAEAIWPENEYIDERKVMRTYIHRLRKIISAENAFHRDYSDIIDIANVKGGYLCSLKGNYELDSALFEALELELSKESDPAGLFNGWGRLHELYNGEYLEDCRFDQWAIPLRAHFLRSYVNLTASVINKLTGAKEYAKAIEIGDKSLKIAPLDEGLNVAYLTALLDGDQPTTAYNHYTDLTSRMHTGLSAMPSKKLRSVYERIKDMRKQFESIENIPSEFVDRHSIMSMISDAVKIYLTNDSAKYSLVFVEAVVKSERESADSGVKPDDSAAILEALRFSLEVALRRNDMFALIDDARAIIILQDAKEGFLTNITHRIQNAFYGKYEGTAYTLRVKTYSVTTID